MWSRLGRWFKRRNRRTHICDREHGTWSVGLLARTIRPSRVADLPVVSLDVSFG